ncbi:MAG: SAM-dependent methyltransferase [Hungatella sp.]|jgi:SAM-dependent methyltransferase|nr:SAM-dependent methyltransferase [Hungatella sp.]
MDSLKDYITRIFTDHPYKIVISKPVGKTEAYKKIVIDQKDGYYQLAKYTDKQVFHENIKEDNLPARCLEFLEHSHLKLNAWTGDQEYSLSLSKKRKILFHAAKNASSEPIPWNPAHNLTKRYILEEGQVILPLVDMGIFTREGKVVKSMYDKYRQINRFIELIDDVVKKQNCEHLNIIDFGCGKSYLTFILYHYLTVIRKISVNMIGLDLKADVIGKCNAAALKYGYDNLRFELGDIKGFSCPFDVDMVISLHACDTATDYALYNAVSWNARMIFSVPCCQHELNKQISTDTFSLFTRYGIISERFCALMTDAIRANLLEYSGYSTQLLEFVDFEHTPKNILIRAIKSPGKPEKSRQKALKEAKVVIDEYRLSPTLYGLLAGERPTD